MGELRFTATDELLARLRARALAERRPVEDLVRELVELGWSTAGGQGDPAPGSAAARQRALAELRATRGKLPPGEPLAEDLIRAMRDSR